MSQIKDRLGFGFISKNKEMMVKGFIPELEELKGEIDPSISIQFYEDTIRKKRVIFMELTKEEKVLTFKHYGNSNCFEVQPHINQDEDHEAIYGAFKHAFVPLFDYWKRVGKNLDKKIIQVQIHLLRNLLNQYGLDGDRFKRLEKAIGPLEYIKTEAGDLDLYQGFSLVEKKPKSFMVFLEEGLIPKEARAAIAFFETLKMKKKEEPAFQFKKKDFLHYPYTFLGVSGIFTLKEKEGTFWVTEETIGMDERLRSFDLERCLSKIEEKIRVKVLFDPPVGQLSIQSSNNQKKEIYRELLRHYSYREVENALGGTHREGHILDYKLMVINHHWLIANRDCYRLFDSKEELEIFVKEKAAKKMETIIG